MSFSTHMSRITGGTTACNGRLSQAKSWVKIKSSFTLTTGVIHIKHMLYLYRTFPCPTSATRINQFQTFFILRDSGHSNISLGCSAADIVFSRKLPCQWQGRAREHSIRHFYTFKLCTINFTTRPPNTTHHSMQASLTLRAINIAALKM